VRRGRRERGRARGPVLHGGAGYGTQAKRNLLYIQLQDHTFVNRSAQYGVLVLEPFGRGRAGTFIRANGEAFPDLFVANERERADGMPSSNRLFINQTGSAYRYAPEYGLERELGDGADTGGDAAVADVNKDGWQDLLAQTDSGLRLYRNDQGSRFTDVTGSVGLGRSAVDATLADVNGDTWPDVVEVTSTQLSVLHNTNGSFSLAFSAPLSSELAVAAGDVNGDARSDLYVMQKQSATSANAPDRVYLNDGTGSSFSLMSSIPSTSEGAAESVWPIDHDGNGLTDFLVLNGNDQAEGHVQLIAFYPAS
jgi:FG-GAP-like repeat